MADPGRRGHHGPSMPLANRQKVCKSGRQRLSGEPRMGLRSRGNEGNSADAAELRTRNAALNRMVCEDCGTVYFSAAARTMVERGERCPKCGGRLVLANGPRPLGPRERCEHNDPPAKA